MGFKRRGASNESAIKKSESAEVFGGVGVMGVTQPQNRFGEGRWVGYGSVGTGRGDKGEKDTLHIYI